MNVLYKLLAAGLFALSNVVHAGLINIEVFNGTDYHGSPSTYNLDMRPYLSDLNAGVDSVQLLLSFSDDFDSLSMNTTYSQTVSSASLSQHVGGIRLDQTKTEVRENQIESARITSSLFSQAFSFQSEITTSTSNPYTNKFVGRTSSSGFSAQNTDPNGFQPNVICHSCPVYEDYIITQNIYSGDFFGEIDLVPGDFISRVFFNPFETINISSNFGDFYVKNITLAVNIRDQNSTNTIPEPTSLALLCLGIIGMRFIRKKSITKC